MYRQIAMHFKCLIRNNSHNLSTVRKFLYRNDGVHNFKDVCTVHKFYCILLQRSLWFSIWPASSGAGDAAAEARKLSRYIMLSSHVRFHAVRVETIGAINAAVPGGGFCMRRGASFWDVGVCSCLYWRIAAVVKTGKYAFIAEAHTRGYEHLPKPRWLLLFKIHDLNKACRPFLILYILYYFIIVFKFHSLFYSILCSF